LCIVDRLAEEQPEARSRGTELCRRCRGHVELKLVRKKKDPVYGRVTNEIEQRERAELVCEWPCPLVENSFDRRPFDAERQIEIRPAVTRANDARADLSGGGDMPVLPGQLQDPQPHRLAFLDAEHASS